jgi:hypothetical protein
MYIYDTDVDFTKTYHEYIENLDPLLKDSTDTIKNGEIMKKIANMYPEDIIESIDGMNEIYITCIGANGSDKVFEEAHLDGPFFFLPFCTVLRCIFTIQGNNSVFTEFPGSGERYSLQNGEFLAFDYNRDAHFIYKDEKVKNNTSRILLKLHYLITPRFVPRPIAAFYRNLHCKYNSFMRESFLASQKKDSALANVINCGTKVYYFLYKNKDILSVALAGAVLFMIWD